MPFKPANGPDLQAAGDSFARFCETIAMLRDPKQGCPWDLQQTHQSLIRYLLEESYEVIRAIEAQDSGDLQEELGDLLLQVVLHAQLARDAGTFSMEQVVEGIDAKMRRRHPHVFQPETAQPAMTKEEHSRQWQEIKATEKAGTSLEAASGSVFDKAGVQKILPPAQQALAIGKIAHRIGFDWDTAAEVVEQLSSETEELREATAHFKADADAPATAREHLLDELGDVFFSLFQVCRHLDVHPDAIADRGNRKFLSRFRKAEEIGHRQGISVETAGKARLEQLWIQAKSED